MTNVASFYWAVFQYGRYFSHVHPKLPENHKAVAIIMKLENIAALKHGSEQGDDDSSLTIQKASCRVRGDGMMEPSSNIYKVDISPDNIV